MMNKEKSSKKNNWKVFLLIPSCILIALAFACTEKSQTISADQSILKPVYFEVEQMPEYKGGFDSMRKFIASNVKFPDEAAKAGVTGKVLVQFVVNEKGKVDLDLQNYNIDKEILKQGIEPGAIDVVSFLPAEGSTKENIEKYSELLKQEAVRVISSLPDFEKPGMQDGKAVAVMFTIPINFALQ